MNSIASRGDKRIPWLVTKYASLLHLYKLYNLYALQKLDPSLDPFNRIYVLPFRSNYSLGESNGVRLNLPEIWSRLNRCQHALTPRRQKPKRELNARVINSLTDNC